MREWWVGKNKETRQAAVAVCWLCASLAALRGREKGQGSQQHDISGENRKTSVSLLRRQLQRGTHLSTRGPRGKAVPPFAAALLLYRNDATPWRPLECNSYFA